MSAQKQRHGCLTAYLLLMIVANSAIAIASAYLFWSSAIQGMPSLKLIVMASFATFLPIFNLVCAIALLKWKKWGFWGFIVSGIVMLFANISVGRGIGQALLGLVGVAVVYGVLHIGKENKGWPQLD